MRKGQFIDITGHKYGRLTALRRVTAEGRSKWECQCDCGNIAVVSISNLRNGHTRSCGCFEKERNSETHTVHGGSRKGKRDRLYHVWKMMRQRCNCTYNEAYKHYGGRGIKVCDEWNNSYGAFKRWAMEHGYDPNAKSFKCTIDRIDVNGNYEPDNCRWVDMKVQANNTRRNQCRRTGEYIVDTRFVGKWCPLIEEGEDG